MYVVLGFRYQGRDISNLYQVLEQVPGTSYLVYVPTTWQWVPGTQYLKSAAWMCYIYYICGWYAGHVILSCQ